MYVTESIHVQMEPTHISYVIRLSMTQSHSIMPVQSSELRATKLLGWKPHTFKVVQILQKVDCAALIMGL